MNDFKSVACVPTFSLPLEVYFCAPFFFLVAFAVFFGVFHQSRVCRVNRRSTSFRQKLALLLGCPARKKFEAKLKTTYDVLSEDFESLKVVFSHFCTDLLSKYDESLSSHLLSLPHPDLDDLAVCAEHVKETDPHLCNETLAQMNLTFNFDFFI